VTELVSIFLRLFLRSATNELDRLAKKNSAHTGDSVSLDMLMWVLLASPWGCDETGPNHAYRDLKNQLVRFQYDMASLSFASSFSSPSSST
jgi:hypothetical protein